MTADEYLTDVWRELRNDASPQKLEQAKSAAVALLAVGQLGVDQCELWVRRFKSCPGHEDEGGRSWCAYCGAMNEPPTRQRGER